MTSKYQLTAILKQEGYSRSIQEIPITVYADTYGDATDLAKDRLYPAPAYRYWDFRTERITEVEPHKVPLKTVDLSPESLEQLAKIFSSRVEVPKEPAVRVLDPHGCKTPEEFQTEWITRDYDEIAQEYLAWCDYCAWDTDGSHESVVDVAAYEHAEKHVNEEKEHN